jgi:hypothetical protein
VCEVFVKITMGDVVYEFLVGSDVHRDVMYSELRDISGKVPVVLCYAEKGPDGSVRVLSAAQPENVFIPLELAQRFLDEARKL